MPVAAHRDGGSATVAKIPQFNLSTRESGYMFGSGVTQLALTIIGSRAMLRGRGARTAEELVPGRTSASRPAAEPQTRPAEARPTRPAPERPPAPAEPNCFAAGTQVALADEQELNQAAAECGSWNWYALTLSLASLAAAGAVWRLTGPGGRRSRKAQSEALLDQVFAEDWLNDGDRETHELADLDCLFAEGWLKGQAEKVNRAA